MLVRGDGPALRARGGRLRPAQRHRGPARRRAAGATALPLAVARRGRGTVGGDPRLPAATAPTTCAPRGVGRPARVVTAGRLRPRAGQRRLDRRCAAWCARGNSGGPLVDGDGRVRRRRSSPPPRAVRRGGYGVPNAIVARRAARARAGAVSTPAPAPADRDRYACGLHGQDPRHRREAVRRARPRRAPPRRVRQAARATSSPTSTSSPGRSATSSSSPSPTSTTPKYKKWRMADLPIVPDALQARRARRALAQADVGHQRSCSAATTSTSVVNACDAGREGELIFAYLYEKAGAKQARAAAVAVVDDDGGDQAGVRRRCGPASELHTLEEAARSRSEADWIVGMNATRAATIRLRSSFDGAVSLGPRADADAGDRRRAARRRSARSSRSRTGSSTRRSSRVGRHGAPLRRAASTPARSRGSQTAEEAEAIVAAVRGRRGRDHQAREDDEEGARAAPLRPDLAAARREHALRLLRAAHAGGGAAALRGAQGAHLPAHELALPVRRHGRARSSRRLAGRRREPASTRAPRRTSPGLDVLPLGPRGQRRQGHRPPRDHPDARRAPRRQDVRRRPAHLRHGRAALPRRLPPRGGVREHARWRPRSPSTSSARAAACCSSRAGAASTARRGRRRRGARRRRRRGRDQTAARSSSAARPSTRARSRRPRRRPSRRAATPTRRCSARWRPRASSSTTTSCARR